MSLPSALPCQPRGSWSRLRSSGLFLLVFLALPFTVSCGAARSSAMRSNSSAREGRLVLTRRPRPAVEVSGAAFEMTLAMLAADVHASRRPFEGRLVLASWQPQGGVERELADGFRQWCGWKQASAARSGCESILEDDGRWLGLDTREAMAIAIAMSSVGDGAVEAVKGMVDPVAFKAMLYTALATCMALLVLPEPTSKALVVAITVGLCTYLGWSTVWGILQGWKRLSAATKAARTFDELSAAGERFGKLLGANTARVMVMVATTALGSTGGTVWASAGARLPGWGQALQLATAEGLAPALAAPAASVMVAGETLTIGLAVGVSVEMAATTSPGVSEARQTPSATAEGSQNRQGSLHGLGNIGSHGPIKPEVALDAARKWLGEGYMEIAPGVYRSADGLRQFRMTSADLLPTHGSIGSHVHFEALNEAGVVIENLHLPVSR